MEEKIMHLLITEDDMALAQGLQRALQEKNRQVLCCKNIQETRQHLHQNKTDLLILDVNLPDGSGFDLLQEIRRTSDLPVILLTANDLEMDIVSGLEQGANDYITKPFGTSELLARIRTALRHTRTDGTSDGLAMTGEYHVGDLCIDYNKHRVFLAGEDTHLTPNEYKIVALLGRHAGQVLTYKSMMKELWGPGVGGDNKLLRVHMANIRRKIEPNPVEPQYIFTEVGVGYRMADSH